VNWIVVKKFPVEQDLTYVTGYLHECKIEHRIYEEAGMQVIAVLDPRLVPSITQLLNELERGTLVIQKNEVDVEPEAASNNDNLSPSFSQQAKAAPITIVLILLSILGALIVAFEPEKLWAQYLSFQGACNANSLSLLGCFDSGQIWRLITPTFLHFSFVHIFFNSLAVWDFGRRLEPVMGKANYFFFFIITAALSNIAQYLWHPLVLFGGISGFAYALVGFIMVSQKIAPHASTEIKPAALGFILFWLVLCMTGALDSFIGGGVANAAHIGGLLAGCVYAFLTVKPTSLNV
jgi:GlpG protein